MSYTRNDYSECKEKEYYDDKKCCMKQDKCCKKQDDCWDDMSWGDDCWEEKCCKKHDTCWEEECCKNQDKCCNKHHDCCDDKCCMKHNDCCDGKCCKKHDKCCEDGCCKKCDNCHEIKKLLKEAYKYAFRARVAILAIFEFKNPCKHMDAIKYFFCKAKESVKCLFKILEKLCWCFDKKCFRCNCEAAYMSQKAIRNTEAVAYALCGLEELCDPCCNEWERCEAICYTTEALERIEDVVREIESLFKLFKKDKCKKY